MLKGENHWGVKIDTSDKTSYTDALSVKMVRGYGDRHKGLMEALRHCITVEVFGDKGVNEGETYTYIINIGRAESTTFCEHWQLSFKGDYDL